MANYVIMPPIKTQTTTATKTSVIIAGSVMLATSSVALFLSWGMMAVLGFSLDSVRSAAPNKLFSQKSIDSANINSYPTPPNPLKNLWYKHPINDFEDKRLPQNQALPGFLSADVWKSEDAHVTKLIPKNYKSKDLFRQGGTGRIAPKITADAFINRRLIFA